MLYTAELPDIPAPNVEYAIVAPLLIILGAAVLGVVLEAALPRGRRFVPQALLAAVAIVAAFVDTVWVYRSLDAVSLGQLTGRGQLAIEGSISVDGPAVLTWGGLLIFGLLCLGLFVDRKLDGGLSPFTGRAADAPGSAGEAEAIEARLEHTEVFPLMMFTLGGMMLFASAQDLITMFVALEVVSLPLYVLCALSRRRRLISQEAALKYFLLGAFSSVFFLYGAALAYGYSGSFSLTKIDLAISARTGDQTLLLASIALIAVGLFFKIGAVPFHQWTPDVYHGAPTPVTALMAAGTKTAALIAFLRVFFVGFGGASWDWRPTIWVIAIITMAVGSLVSIAQTDVKRMLAYSSVAHAGFLLVGFAGAYAGGDGLRMTSIAAIMFYLLVYGLASIGAFAVVTVVRDSAGETTHLSRWAGLGKESPFLAGSFALFMLSFAGIPLTGGFIGKWAVFSAAWSGGYWPLVVVGVLLSAVAAYFYVRVIVLMFFTDPDQSQGPTVAVSGVVTTVVITATAVATFVLGVVPGPVLDLVQHAGAFVR